MQDAQIQALATQVLWLGFALAIVFGGVAQRTHFCTMGAVADIVNMGDWSRMRMWALAAGVAIVGFNAMVAAGWVEAGDSIYATPKFIWLSNALGGVMFGFGMVLASGCGSKTLVRLGAGNLKSLLVFVVLGLAAFATLKGITAVARVATVDRAALTLPAGQDLPSLLAGATGVARPALALALGLVVGGALLVWALARPEGRSRDALLGGLVTGALIAGVWWASGRLGHVAEHPLTLEETFLATNSQRMESLSFVSPIAYTLDWLLFFSDQSKVLTLGIVTTVGVVLGSAAVALATRTFRWEAFGGVEDTANHFVGALLMGVGGVTALGCTIGQGLSGLSTLSLGSVIALAGILSGAVLALRYQVWRLERMALMAALIEPHAEAVDADLERRFGGLRRLYGDAGYARVRAAHVAVVGLGGVGSWAVEALARSGVAALTLIDLDHVAESNINRQLQATTQTLGMAKPQALAQRIAGIHPGCTVHAVEDFAAPNNWPQLLPAPVDAVIDACDQMSAKAAIASWALAARVPLVCAGAAGGKRAAQRVEVADLVDVTHDPLLAALRQRLRKAGAPRGGAMGVRCVFSREAVLKPDAAGCALGEDEPIDGSLNCHGYGSSVSVTATFGMVAAGELMQWLSGAAAPPTGGPRTR